MIDAITGFLGTILYPLFSIIFTCIDILQNIFFSFAGIVPMEINGTTVSSNAVDKDGGLVYFLFQTDIIRNMFYSILLLAIFLLIIFTVMAFIKNAYTDRPKGWKDIIGNTFKGLANFIFIPVCCLLGVWLGNILLQAINGATNVGGSASLSGQLFVCSAYNSNRFRNGDFTQSDVNNDNSQAMKEIRWAYQHYKGITEEEAKAQVKTGQSLDYYADLADECYASNKVDLNWYWNVDNCYSLWSINYLLLVAGGIFMLYVLVSLAYGMIRRMFLLLMLFIISPALCAYYPLDGGSAVGQWKKNFIGNTISAYGAVAGMNLFFAIAPIIQQIRITGPGGAALDILGIVPLILTVSGLYVVKDFISMIGGYFGAENAYTAGAGLRSSVRSGVKKYGEKINKGTTSAVGAFAKADAVRRAGGNAWDVTRSLGMSALSPFGSGLKGLTGIDFEANRKAVREAREKGQKEIQDRAKADTVENISRMPGTNREIIERAKTAGVEKEVAAILADRLNAAEVRRQRRDDQYIMKHNTGDSVLADLKTVKDTVDAFKDITNAKNRMNNAAEIFSNAGVDNAITSSLGLGNTTDTAAISRLSRGYTDAEIDAETDANRKLAMGEFNRAHEEWKERRSEFNESLSKAKTLSKDALKLTHAEYNDQISGSILNWHDLEGNHHTGVVNSTNISTIFQIAKDQSDDASLASLRTVVNLLENVSDSLNQRRVDIIRHDTREINRRAGNTKDSK